MPKDSSLVVGKAGWEPMELMQPKKAFKHWKSESKGPRFYLSWRESPEIHSRRGINAVLRAFEQMNSQREREDAHEQYLHASVVAKAQAEARRIRAELSSIVTGPLVEAEASTTVVNLVEFEFEPNGTEVEVRDAEISVLGLDLVEVDRELIDIDVALLEADVPVAMERLRLILRDDI
jgi:hypothetical protein